MMLPGIIAIGPMKAGTTWLHDFLAARGDICLPKGVKETHFFDTHFHKGTRWYEDHFSHFAPNRHRSIVEVAPSYFHCAQAPQRIRSTIGQVRVIATLRDPVRRAWSHYLHLLRYGLTTDGIRDAVIAFPEILEASKYDRNIELWEQELGAGNVRIAVYEKLVDDATRYAREVATLMDIGFEGLPPLATTAANEAAVAPSPALAQLAYRLGEALRSRRLYPIINIAKALGLKRVLYGAPGRSAVPALDDRTRIWLSQRLAPEVERTMVRLGAGASVWPRE